MCDPFPYRKQRDAKDMDLDYWAGVVPLALTAGPPEPDPAMAGDRDTPAYTLDYKRGRGSES